MSKSKFALSIGKAGDRFHDLIDDIKAKAGRYESANKRWIVSLDDNDPLFADKAIQAEALSADYIPEPNPPRG